MAPRMTRITAICDTHDTSHDTLKLPYVAHMTPRMTRMTAIYDTHDTPGCVWRDMSYMTKLAVKPSGSSHGIKGFKPNVVKLLPAGRFLRGCLQN